MNALVLLIGSNNIPNYVTAKYLLNPERKDTNELPVPERLFLVFSSSTSRYKDKLVSCLEFDREHIVDVPLGCKERGHNSIKKILFDRLKEHEILSVHLNYTGGTKAMVLAAYEAVEMSSSDKKIYSYLDYDNSKFVLSNSNNSFPINGDLKDWVKPTINEIFALHCLGESLQYKDQLNSEKFTHLFSKENFITAVSSMEFQKDLEIFEEAERLNKATYEKKLRDRYFIILEEMFNNANADSELGCIVKKLTSLNYNQEEYKRTHVEWYIEGFGNILKKHFDVYDEISCESVAESGCGPRNNTDMAKKYGHFYDDFLKFIWLEQLVFYVLKKIQESKESFGLTYVFWDVKGYSNGREFQVDVLALRSFETIIFSCTSSDETCICKQKAFEVNYRAIQIGGEHAKSVLVCLKENDSKNRVGAMHIKNDMSQFDAARNFSIIGRDSLSSVGKLKKAIIEILKK